MEIIECEQGSAEWEELRLGKVTSTRLKKVMARSNLPLIDEIIAEELTGMAKDNYTTEAMQRGIDMEPLARKRYTEKTKNKINEVGFCVSEEMPFVGLSPDGFTEDLKGAIEIKSPMSHTHVTYLRTKRVPAEYKFQILHYFIVNPKLEWLDFVSFDPRFKTHDILILRKTREELAEEIAHCTVALKEFWEKKVDIQEAILF